MGKKNLLLGCLGILLISCAPEFSESPGHWSGIIQGKPAEVTWWPASPRIGDVVKLETTWNQGLFFGEDSQPLEPLDSPGETHRYLLLMRHSGPFRFTDWPETLWTVPEEKNYSEGWHSLTPEEALGHPDQLTWVWIALGGFLLLVLSGLLFYRRISNGKIKGQASPEEDKQLLKELEGAKTRLHDLGPKDIPALIGLLDRCWQTPPQGEPGEAWFFQPGMTWETLESRYEEKRKNALYAGSGGEWEIWEEEVDALLFRLRGTHV